jgi:hypothetical protein
MNSNEFEYLIKDSGLNQSDMSRILNINNNTISKWKKSGNFPLWVEGWLEGRIQKKKIDSLAIILNSIIKQ